MNHAASSLGKLGKGKPKRLSKAEIARRTKRLAEARKKRWRASINVVLDRQPKIGEHLTDDSGRVFEVQAVNPRPGSVFEVTAIEVL